MLRIRFHGRGGHGIKTSSRILGTAAFLSGKQAQDCPVYGAERRGAPIAAFTRIDDQPIVERGGIADPDLILIADLTLLADSSAGGLQGVECASGLFLNSAASADALVAGCRYFLPGVVRACDLTAITEEELGKVHNLSAGLGAAGCAMTGTISEEVMLQAVREELTDLELSPEVIEKNLQVARRVFGVVQPVPLRAKRAPPLPGIYRPRLVVGARGVPILFAPGNSLARQTGFWRTARPVIDRAACSRCLICALRCPEGVIGLDSEGYPVIDHDHCKGCMICVRECPLRCIEEQKEVPS